VQQGQAGTMGYWAAGLGQSLINAFNGGVGAVGVANWMALSFPNLYGINAGANNLFGKTNAQIALLYQTKYQQAAPQADAEIMATALNVYASTQSLGGTTAQPYGFAISAAGLGARTFNIGANGAAVGAANNSTLNVFELLRAVNAKAVGGVLYNGDATLRKQAASLFDALNVLGGIH